MSPADKTDPDVLTINAPEQNGDKKFVSRDEWLNQAGVLREEEHHIEGLGWLILSEITGDARAEIVGHQSVGLLAEHKKIDAKAYQRSLIMAGTVDPASPPGNRNPMFRPGDMERVMKLGGGKVADIIDVIERLSALGNYAAAAEGNSDSTQNGASTS